MWTIEFYKKVDGEVPVLVFLESLEPKHRAKVFFEIELLQKYGYELTEPFVKKIRGIKYHGLSELRVTIFNNQARIFFFIIGNNNVILLNAFMKKTTRTPRSELERAMRYRKDYESRCKL